MPDFAEINSSTVPTLNVTTDIFIPLQTDHNLNTTTSDVSFPNSTIFAFHASAILYTPSCLTVTQLRK